MSKDEFNAPSAYSYDEVIMSHMTIQKSHIVQ